MLPIVMYSGQALAFPENPPSKVLSDDRTIGMTVQLGPLGPDEPEI